LIRETPKAFSFTRRGTIMWARSQTFCSAEGGRSPVAWGSLSARAETEKPRNNPAIRKTKPEGRNVGTK
jgi:hypothetical protein